jgi:hypothetical protein
MKDCIKASYSEEEARVWVNRLRFSNPELDWESVHCGSCHGWHIVRNYPPGYIGEEKKKAIAAWKEKRGIA